MLWDNSIPLFKNKSNIENNAPKSKGMCFNTPSSPLLDEYTHFQKLISSMIHWASGAMAEPANTQLAVVTNMQVRNGTESWFSALARIEITCRDSQTPAACVAFLAFLI